MGGLARKMTVGFSSLEKFEPVNCVHTIEKWARPYEPKYIQDRIVLQDQEPEAQGTNDVDGGDMKIDHDEILQEGR